MEDRTDLALEAASALGQNLPDGVTLRKERRGSFSITRVETTGDLRYAKVYVSVLEKEKTRDVLKGLRSAGGYLRREIGGRLQLRYTPELVFEQDDSIEHGAHIFDLIQKLHEKEEGGHEEA